MPVSGKRLCQALKQHGWIHVRTNGSHHIFQHPDRPGVTLVVPVHANRDLKRGLLRNLLKLGGLSEKDV